MSRAAEGARMPSASECQGKCERCRVRYIWPAEQPRVLLRDARCPRCGVALRRTVWYAKGLEVCEIGDQRALLRKVET